MSPTQMNAKRCVKATSFAFRLLWKLHSWKDIKHSIPRIRNKQKKVHREQVKSLPINIHRKKCVYFTFFFSLLIVCDSLNACVGMRPRLKSLAYIWEPTKSILADVFIPMIHLIWNALSLPHHHHLLHLFLLHAHCRGGPIFKYAHFW